MRDAAGELDHFEAALDVALGVRDGLAVLGGEELRQTVELPMQQLQELEHDARAPLWVGRAPATLRGFRIGDRRADLGPARERDLGLDLASIRIEHVAEPARGAFHLLAADKMADLTHTLSPSDWAGALSATGIGRKEGMPPI